MVIIEREVRIEAPPTRVARELETSRWRAGIDLAPEGLGTRVRIRASAGPEPIAAALESAILDEVCAVKRRLETGAVLAQPDAVGKST